MIKRSYGTKKAQRFPSNLPRMAEQHFNPENILELAEELRLAGFDIGTQQHIAALDLLIALAAHNRLPDDPRQWRTLLAPIFCASPAEQEEFYGRYDHWLKRHPEWKAIAEDLIEPDSREISIPAAAIHWLSKPIGIASIALLILIAGFAVFLSLKTDRTLTGEVFSSADGKHLPEAQVEFFNQQTKTDSEGKFTIKYEARNWHRIFNRKFAELKVSHPEHVPFAGFNLDVHQPSHQNISLQKRPAPPIDQSISITAFPPKTEDAPPPIPILPGLRDVATPVTRNQIRWYHWLLVGAPLMMFAAWLLMRWRRRRALLQKLQSAGSPNLRRLTVRGASEQLFQSQAFRRAVQDLHRHRRVATRELDVAATVNATVNRGGIFHPLYGARKALPEYLLLIDRASPADEQARFADELSHRLEAGGVFVDRFYFQDDPRTCRACEAKSPPVTLLELAARFPDHQLLVFSDGAGFISPLTGEAEHWLTMFSHWPHRVLLTPEPASQHGYRELELAENDFLVLPANDDGLFTLTETINTGLTPNLKTARNGNGDQSSFPDLISERPKRWLERHEPRPAALNQLLDQLRAYLGEDGWYWLAACAVYPALSWDVTLYLGYKLISTPTVRDGLSFEERLLRLIRLPWFRYGSMPDWLRLRLIESFTPEQEREVRRTIETMLLTALEHPQEGIPLDIAERQTTEPGDWWQRLKTLWNEWREKKRIADFIEKEIEKEVEDSPLKDFVFLGFLSGGRARRLTVKLPELINRLLFPQGQAVLGFRPATAAALAILLTGTGAAIVANRSQQPDPAPPALSQFYQQWDQTRQSQFVVEKTGQILSALADKTDTPLKEEDFDLIRQKVSEYAARVGNGSTYDKFASLEQPNPVPLPEDLSYVFGRGVKYAPEISKAFTAGKYKRDLPGLYMAMAESEFRPCPTGTMARQGMFLRVDLRTNPQQGCDWQKDALEISDYFARIIGDSNTTNKTLQAIAGANYLTGEDSATLNMMSGYVWNLLVSLRIPNNPGQEQQDNNERSQLVDYVYRILAAAIVGENPRSFGLDMEPLSRYAQAAQVSPSPSPEVSPTITTTPTPTPILRMERCLSDKDLSGEYVVRSIVARDSDGQTKDITYVYPLNSYLQILYSRVSDLDKLLNDAKPILAAEKINLPSPAICLVRSNTTQRCVGTTTPMEPRAPRPAPCVDVILTSGALAGQSGAPQTGSQTALYEVREMSNRYVVSIVGGGRKMELVKLPGGQFTMGSNNGVDNEKLPHQVQVSAFSIGKYEVTQSQWQAVMGTNPSYFKGDHNLPVDSISWDDAVKFCEQLSAKTGYSFRLPTEAEWEYACRAGTNTEYSFGDDPKLLGEYAWYGENSGNKTHPVGGKKPNGFNLFDMHGNVWEWCQDYWHNNYNGAPSNGSAWLRGGDSRYRVLRGGSWGGSIDLRSADRVRNAPGGIVSSVGFRVVLFARIP